MIQPHAKLCYRLGTLAMTLLSFWILGYSTTKLEACDLYGITTYCWQTDKQSGTNVSVVINDKPFTGWLVTTTGCAFAKCDCTGTGPESHFRAATATPECTPKGGNSANVVVANPAKPTDTCKNPTGPIQKGSGALACTVTTEKPQSIGPRSGNPSKGSGVVVAQ